MRRLTAELMGTFIIVFAGTGAVVVNDTSGGAVTHVGVALTFGLVVLALIYAVGETSGAHLNPAVSVGFAVSGRFPWRAVPGYTFAQAAGAFTASLLLRFLFPEHANLGATLPAKWSGAEAAFVFETVLTFILMFVILGVSTGAKEKGVLAGIAVGAVIGFEALFAGPVCGASMNPVRSLAPAMVSGQTQHLWVYLAAPALGAILGVGGHWLCRAEPNGG